MAAPMPNPDLTGMAHRAGNSYALPMPSGPRPLPQAVSYFVVIRLILALIYIPQFPLTHQHTSTHTHG